MGLFSRPVTPHGYVRVGMSGKVRIKEGDDVAAKIREAARRDKAAKEFARWLRKERGWQ